MAFAIVTIEEKMIIWRLSVNRRQSVLLVWKPVNAVTWKHKCNRVAESAKQLGLKHYLLCELSKTRLIGSIYKGLFIPKS